jgi:hypothetical protein
MNSNPEKRDKTRFEHESTVTLENNDLDLKRNARMYNYSDQGLYIEADHLLEPNTEIRIGIGNSPYAREPDQFECFRGVIKWRKNLKRSVYYYGYGIEIIQNNTIAENAEKQYQGSRRHSRKEYSIPVKYASDGQTFDGMTGNVSSGGVYIKTLDPVPVGQHVTIDIPLKKKGKIKRLSGKVTWSRRGGFGAKFIRSDRAS